MTTLALAAASVAVAVLALALAASALTLRRARRSTDERFARAVAEVNERMESMVLELQEALDHAHEEVRRGRFVHELAATIDLDEVVERLLRAAAGVQGADAALLTLDEGQGSPTVATLGLSPEEAARQAVAGPPDSRDVRSISISYSYDAEELGKGEPLIQAGVAVPLRATTGPLGMLAVFTRSTSAELGDDTVAELEQLAERAGPAVENARRFREARQLADLDALTELHNRRYFHEMLARECARAHRYERRLALIVLDLDDFKAVNDRIGHLAGDEVLAEVAERIRSVVRSADVACRVGGDEFAVIMPESTLQDASQLSHRLQAAVSERPIAAAGRLEMSAGVAEFTPSDSATSFFERADEALYRAKQGGKGRVVEASPQYPRRVEESPLR